LRTERLKHVATIRVSNVDKKSADDELPVRLCNYTDVYYNERITSDLDFMAATATRVQHMAFGLQVGDVVLTKDSETADDIGVSALIAEDVPDLVCGYHLAIVRPRAEATYGPYLRWVLASDAARQAMSMAATGVTRFGLRSEAIADLAVPMRSLEEQREIVDYLDRETARIDALIVAKRDQVSRLEERVDALVQEAIDRSRPDSLPLRRLVAAFVDYRGATPEKSSSGVPLITATNVKNGRINLALGEQFVTDETYTLWMRRGFPAVGDVLITTEAPLGEVAAITDAHVALAQRIILLKPNRDRVVPGFLRVSLLSSRVQADLLSRASGSTVWGIRADRLRDVMVPLPGPAEQQRVVEIARDAEQASLVTRRLINRQVQLLTERRQALITAAVTGRLDVPVAA
jgi:type I restriction enzyme S subunit